MGHPGFCGDEGKGNGNSKCRSFGFAQDDSFWDCLWRICMLGIQIVRELMFMAKLTIVFGILLVAVGAWGFVATGSAHPTALIPAGFGLLFVVFGILANSPEPKKRMLWMHIAVTLALVLFLSLIKADIQMVQMMQGMSFEHPVAVQEKAIASVLSLVFVLLCVRSFISARRARLG